jgi:hypothetical protein
MKRYLISFDDDAMTFPEEDGPAVAEAAHAVSREATDAGPPSLWRGSRPGTRVSLLSWTSIWATTANSYRTCSSET